MTKTIKAIIILTFMLCILTASVAAEKLPFVHSLFTDHMILQRETPCPVWGWSTPGDVIQVKFAGQTKQATTDKDGRWEIKLDPMQANSKGQELIVKTTNNKRKATFEDVLVGDIWLCSGQSNMEFGITSANQWWNELPKAPINDIRLFWVQPNPCFKEQQNVLASKWQIASRHSLQKIKNPYFSTVGFSAIAWFFGRKLYHDIKVPIGLIESSQGNTAIQPWSTIKSLNRQDKKSDKNSLEKYETMLNDWAKQSDPNWPENQKYTKQDYDDKPWQTIDLSKSKTDNFNGMRWYRKHINIPQKQSLSLNIGPLKIQNTAWFNGHFIGGQDKSRKNIKNKAIEHIFHIPESIVRKGENVIVVRTIGKQGLSKQASLKGKSINLTLTDNWQYKQGTPTAKLLRRRSQPLAIWIPGGLYNGMIASLAPFAIKGAIWYQGEGNAGQGDYAKRLTDMIQDWRSLFKVGKFPFYIVQLANFRPLTEKPEESGWAVTRELQGRVAKEVPNCGLAVAIDRGEIYDIHPPNKRDVGNRLALVALAKTYGKDLECEGPTFKSIQINGDRIKITFDHAKGLKSLGGTPCGFAICGEAGKWLWANAQVIGKTVEVWNSEVPKPIAVRYGWGNNIICNLYNEANLPAVPFRTK